jgi:hypothetical protein
MAAARSSASSARRFAALGPAAFFEVPGGFTLACFFAAFFEVPTWFAAAAFFENFFADFFFVVPGRFAADPFAAGFFAVFFFVVFFTSVGSDGATGRGPFGGACLGLCLAEASSGRFVTATQIFYAKRRSAGKCEGCFSAAIRVGPARRSGQSPRERGMLSQHGLSDDRRLGATRRWSTTERRSPRGRAR